MKIAVIWASNNQEKYGYKIVEVLHKKGHIVFPINPKEKVIYNLQCYPNIQSISDHIDIYCFVVPPEITLKILQKHTSLLSQSQIWCQPWSSNKLVKECLKEKFKNYTTDTCLMLEYK